MLNASACVFSLTTHTHLSWSSCAFRFCRPWTHRLDGCLEPSVLELLGGRSYPPPSPPILLQPLKRPVASMQYSSCLVLSYNTTHTHTVFPIWLRNGLSGDVLHKMVSIRSSLQAIQDALLLGCCLLRDITYCDLFPYLLKRVLLSCLLTLSTIYACSLRNKLISQLIKRNLLRDSQH